MELRVEIIGLCLLVPEPKHDRLHVLIPTTEGHAHHGAGHGTGAGVPKHVLDVNFEGMPPDFRMKGNVLDVTGGGGSGPGEPLPETLLRVDRLAGVSLDPKQIGETPDAAVTARVTLPLRGRVQEARRVNWRVDGGEVDLTHALTWIVPGVQPNGWSHRPLRRPGELPQQHAPDPDDDGVIRLTIKHTQEPEPIFKKDDPADHVEAYYRLLGSGATGPTPYLNEDPPATVTGGGGHKSLEPPPPWGGTPFNCMLAQADPPP